VTSPSVQCRDGPFSVKIETMNEFKHFFYAINTAESRESQQKTKQKSIDRHDTKKVMFSIGIDFQSKK